MAGTGEDFYRFGQEGGRTRSAWIKETIRTRFGRGGSGALSTLYPNGKIGNHVPRMAGIAGKVFLVVARIRDRKELGPFAEFKKQVEVLLSEFADRCRRWKKPEAEVDSARFALISLINETVLSSENDCETAWQENPLKWGDSQERLAGTIFFENLEALEAGFPESSECLEIYYLCLVFGFRGQYISDGLEAITAIRKRVHDRLQGKSPRTARPLPVYMKPGRVPDRMGRRSFLLLAVLPFAILLLAYLLLVPLSGLSMETARAVAAGIDPAGRTRP